MRPVQLDDDVVEHGAEPAGGGPPGWLRRAAVVVLAGLALVAVVRGGLLSADEPSPGPGPGPGPSPAPQGTTSGSGGPHLVARRGDRLVAVRDGGLQRATELPAELPDDAPLATVRRSGGAPGPVVGVSAVELFRADPDLGRYRSLGLADALVGASPEPGRVYVVRSGGIQEVDVDTGTTLTRNAFPGFDPRAAIEGVLVSNGDPAVVQGRDTADGRVELSLLWSRGDIDLGARPAVQHLGVVDRFLGIAADWALGLDGCPGATCRVVVASTTRDRVLSRAVEPPPGWTFVAGPSAGSTQEALVPVRERSSGRLALARLVPGGQRALVVRGTDRVVLDADLVDGPAGTVWLLARSGGATPPRVRVWDPVQPNVASLLRPVAAMPSDARLVCVCG
jgi:hypothetical protein